MAGGPRTEGLEAALGAHVEAGWLPGAVALVGAGSEEKVVCVGGLDFGGPPLGPDALFRIASLTKPIAAAVAMLLVEEGLFALDEPVDRLLPELAGRRVLRRWDGPLDAAEPAGAPILVEHLMSQRMGLGAIMSADPVPIAVAMAEAGVAPGWALPDFPDGDAYLAALGALPLARRPGEAWLYDTPAQALGVLIERAAGAPLDQVFRERLFEPLGMRDTGFGAPAGAAGRLGPLDGRDLETGALVATDPGGAASRFAGPQGFLSASGGLVSTVGDYAAFARMMRDGGLDRGRRVLSEASVAEICRDRIPPEVKAVSPFGTGFWERRGWGLNLAVVAADEPDEPRGFGWDGGYGTTAYWDPATGFMGVLFTARMMESPEPPAIFRDFWREARAAAGV